MSLNPMLTRPEIEAAVERGFNLAQTLSPIDVVARLNAAQALVAAAQLRTASMETGNANAQQQAGANESAQAAFDALLITSLVNVRALTGFTGSAGRVLVFADHSVLITDGRYAERAADELRDANADCEVVIETTIAAQNQAIAQRVADLSAVGLEGAHVTWTDLETYDAVIEPQLVRTDHVIESLRRTKNGPELERLARASRIADNAFTSVWKELSSGLTERAFAQRLEMTMREMGADDVSFASIIASGPNGSRPHHEPGERVMVEGDLVICDFGALVDGYHSDTTRTVCIGEPSKAQRRHLDEVLRSQARGRSLVTAGAEGRVIDQACRDSLAEVGWAEYLTTGTGHGSGLVIHEEPWLGKTSTSVLAACDITTVEPGVYVPGEAGVRIEDSMVVTATDPVLLTRLPYEFVL